MYDSYHFNRRQFIQASGIALGTSLLAACGNSETAEVDPNLDQVKLGLSWKAQAEYGGFYQAVAQGFYQDAGLAVEIQPLPPQGNITQLLMGGLVDFSLGQSVNALQAAEKGIPKVTIATIFQNEIQVLLAHPNVGNDSLEQLKGKTIFIAPLVSSIYWPLFKQKYGYREGQQRPYNFNMTPFLLDENSAQQGILTSEPYLIEKEGGFEPVILPLSETGLNPYTFTLETTQKLVEDDPDLVQRFVDASIKGWYSYLENPAPGNALIKQDNPEMTDDLITFALEKLDEYGVITTGDAATLGIGAMTEERWKKLAEQLVEIGVLKDTTTFKTAYTLEFINKGVDYYTK